MVPTCHGWRVDTRRGTLAMSNPAMTRTRRSSAATRTLVGLLMFQSLGAIGGGVTFLADTSGRTAGLHTSLLDRTPFEDFLLPGLLLTFGLGVPALVLAISIVWRPTMVVFARIERMTGQYWASAGSALLGVVLLVWIIVQVLLIEFSWFQPLMFAVGVGLTMLPMTASVRRDLATGADRRKGEV